MPTVLTIAGFDPSSGAGVTADLAVFAAHGLFGTSCITALTVQSTLGVAAVHPVEAAVVAHTLDCLEADQPPDGIKIGMLATAACVAAVANYLERLRGSRGQLVVVLDPVLRSSSGRSLLEPDGVAQMRERLLPLVDWTTPNLEELSILSEMPVAAEREMVHRATALLSSRHDALGVLTTGGHMEPPDDLLVSGGRDAPPVWLPGERVETTSTHGTGCALASAFLSRLVLGDDPAQAAAAAKQYVAQALRTASPQGRGRGPMNLLWPLLGSGAGLP